MKDPIFSDEYIQICENGVWLSDWFLDEILHNGDHRNIVFFMTLNKHFDKITKKNSGLPKFRMIAPIEHFDYQDESVFITYSALQRIIDYGLNKDFKSIILLFKDNGIKSKAIKYYCGVKDDQ